MFLYRNKTWGDRVKIILSWLTKSENPANLVMAYFDNSFGHDKTKHEAELKTLYTNIDNTIE